MPGDRFDLPPPRRPPRGPDWRRVARWLLLGTVVMLGYVLYPTARCSVSAAKAAPLGEVEQESEAWDSDTERVKEGLGFFGRVRQGVKGCYAEHSIGGQESWKKGALAGLAAGTLLFWIIGRMTTPPGAALD